MTDNTGPGRTMLDSEPSWPAEPTPPPGTPNVVFCVFDDVGFSDFGCYGSEIATPNIDRLAAGGLRYTNFHTTSLCSPTRAALLTGRNHHAVGMGFLSNADLGFDGYRGSISKRAALLPEILREEGWNSFAVGKWHLTPMHHTGPAGPFAQWPTQRGFDRFYGFMDGAMNHWEPLLTEDNHHVATPDVEGYHLSTDLMDRAVRLVSDQRSVAPDRPFFLYLAFGAGHSPHHVPREMIDDYIAVFEPGWDATRAARLERQRDMGLVPADTELPPRNPGVPAWDELTDGQRRLFVRFQAAYAAMITHTDREIGRLIDTLGTTGALANTVLVVMSDNGASQEGSQSGTLHQGRYFERAPMTLEQSIDLIDEIGETQWFNNYPLGWAMASNTPCKYYKQNTHAGGIRDPLVIHWPDGIVGDSRGTIRHQFHHATDLTPTVLDVIGVDLPASVNGVEQMPLHGTPMTYTFADADAPTRKAAQYFEMLGHRGLVADGWKAVTIHDPRTLLDDDRWELYHLADDFAERHDLADQRPDVLERLVARWWEEAETYGVLPVDERAGFGTRRRRPARRHWTIWPGLERVPSEAAPNLRNTGHTITARVSVPAGGCEGVLVADGDRWGGYSMFVQDDRACFHYHFPLERHEIRSAAPLGPGDHTIVWRLDKVERSAGRGTLSVDGVEVGAVDIPRIIRGFMPFGGFNVGCDNGAPVALTYTSPFRFTGTLHRVEFDLLDDPPPTDAEQRAALGTQ